MTAVRGDGVREAGGEAGILAARRMSDAAARLLDSSMEAPPTGGAGGQIQQPSRANPLVSNVGHVGPNRL